MKRTLLAGLEAAALVAVFLAIVALLGMALGCAGLPVGVEACFDHPTYGKVCAVLVDGKVYVKADLGMPPEIQKKLESWIMRGAPPEDEDHGPP